MPLDRRQLLHLVAAGGFTFAGCLSDGDQEATPASDGSPTTEQPTTTTQTTQAGGDETTAPTATDGATTAADTTAETPSTAETTTAGSDEPTTAAPTDEPTTTPTTHVTETTVDMVNTTFDPVRASIDPGTRVVWVNQDSLPHTVTSAQFHDVAAYWSFDERAEGGQRITHTFEQAGVYEYYCTIHGREQMCGVVLVGEVALEQSLPCESDGGGTIGY